MTVAVFLTEHLLPYLAPRQRGSKNHRAYAQRVVAAMGSMPMAAVTFREIDAFRSDLIAAGLAAATVNRHLAFLRMAFSTAIKWRMMAGPNPAASPGMLHELPRERYLTDSQCRALFDALSVDRNRDAATAIQLLLATGARKSEILNARISDFDLRAGLLTVPRAKNGRPRRIPLSPLAREIVLGQLATGDGRGDYMFQSSTAGKPITDLRTTWNRAKRRAGIDRAFRLHDLRHTAASAMINNGATLYEVGQVLGHTQLSTTTRYAHLSPQRMIDTATLASSAWAPSRAA